MIAAVKVVGMVAGGREHVVFTASLHDPVLLIPEPTNPYDRFAIAVHTAPRHALLHPDELVSSLTDPAHVGKLHPEDRALLLDRQAGYVPKAVASRFDLPADGVVGYISDVRYAPPEYGPDGTEAEWRPAGFDVSAWFEQREGVDA